MKRFLCFALAAGLLGAAVAALGPEGSAMLGQLQLRNPSASPASGPPATPLAAGAAGSGVASQAPQARAASPRFLLPIALSLEAQVGGMIGPDGTEAQCPLPRDLHVKNRGGSDGAGLCVFASLRHSGLWHDEPALAGLFEFMFTRPGGGYPQKVDQMIGEYCREKHLNRPDYIQVESRDLEILKLACGTGRMPGVTYGVSPTGRYGGQKIAHMVSLVHADDKHFAVLDNNYPGTVEWMSPEEFLRSYTSGSGNGWAVIPLKPGPPLPPHNP